jgi:hypothetical protein
MHPEFVPVQLLVKQHRQLGDRVGVIPSHTWLLPQSTSMQLPFDAGVRQRDPLVLLGGHGGAGLVAREWVAVVLAMGMPPR